MSIITESGSEISFSRALTFWVPSQTQRGLECVEPEDYNCLPRPLSGLVLCTEASIVAKWCVFRKMAESAQSGIPVNEHNVYFGSDSLKKYFNPDCQPPLPLVELPERLNPYYDHGVRIYAKMMTMHPANNVKAMPGMTVPETRYEPC